MRALNRHVEREFNMNNPKKRIGWFPNTIWR
jgi:hypothetical protein